MITAADSNVLLDIIAAHPRFGEDSRSALARAQREGVVVVSEVVWAEIVTGFGEASEGLDAMRRLHVQYRPMEIGAATTAARAWRDFRAQGGTRRERIVADFLIGAHALHHAERLLTRDRGVYRAYFPDLRLLDPTA